MADFDLTVDQLKMALPKSLRNNATQELVDKFNGITSDPILREIYRDNMLSYTSVMEKGRFQIGNYIDAVRYITHKVMGDSNIMAYIKTFPDRYQKFLADGVSDKDIASYIASYNKNKLVNLVREQTLIPTYILNADNYQKAINIQVMLMTDGMVSAKVRSDAANSLLTHLKVPENTKIELDVSIKGDSVIKDLREAALKLVEAQHNQITSGNALPKEIAEMPITIEGKLVD